ncbi:B-cell lymphoma 3 protein-like isoform X2 [Ptychodera flava]
MQGMVDPRSSLFTAAECHLATLQDEDGDTPLHIAVVQSNLPLVEKLIQLIAMSGKSVDIYNTLRQTPLHLAVITNQWQMVRLLVMVGADGNLTDRNGQTSVHLACQRSNMECLHSVTTCSRHPVDLDAKNYEGLTPLHLAVSTGNADVIRFLLSKGADIDCPDGKSGRTALFYAVENEQKDVIEILLDHNADVNAQSYSGNTALHVASGRGFISIVRSLLRHGADMSMKNYHCDTAVTVAKDTSVSKVLYKVYRPEPTVKTPDTSYRKRNLPKQSVTSQHSPCTAIKMEGVETDSCDRSQNVMVGDKIKRIKKERTSSNSSDEGFSSRPSSS